MKVRAKRAEQDRQPKADPRLRVLAQELMLAAAQTLREEFGWGPEEIGRWMDLTLVRAKRNRSG